eukprot:EG_transcript_51687
MCIVMMCEYVPRRNRSAAPVWYPQAQRRRLACPPAMPGIAFLAFVSHMFPHPPSRAPTRHTHMHQLQVVTSAEPHPNSMRCICSGSSPAPSPSKLSVIVLTPFLGSVPAGALSPGRFD